MPWKLRRGAITGTLLHNADNVLCGCLRAGCVNCNPDLPGHLTATLSGFVYGDGTYDVPLYTYACYFRLRHKAGTVFVDLDLYGYLDHTWYGRCIGGDTASSPEPPFPYHSDSIYLNAPFGSPTECDPTGLYDNGAGQTVLISWP